MKWRRRFYVTAKYLATQCMENLCSGGCARWKTKNAGWWTGCEWRGPAAANRSASGDGHTQDFILANRGLM